MVLSASGTNDNCGYPASTFTESTVLCGLTASGGGSQPAVIDVFYNDEHAIPLGCATTTDPVSPLATDPDSVFYPETGDPRCVDTVGRPLRPVLFVTDLTANPSCTAGDEQKGGTPYNPIAIFGSWKSATEGTADAGYVGTPAMMDPMANHWNLGDAGAAIVPPATMTAGTEGYGADLRFEVGLIAGHSYRFQVVVHDGDQNKGGDSGESCAVYCAPNAPSCPPGESACGANGDPNCPEATTCTNGCCVVNGTPIP